MNSPNTRNLPFPVETYESFTDKKDDKNSLKQLVRTSNDVIKFFVNFIKTNENTVNKIEKITSKEDKIASKTSSSLNDISKSLKELLKGFNKMLIATKRSAFTNEENANEAARGARGGKGSKPNKGLLDFLVAGGGGISGFTAIVGSLLGSLLVGIGSGWVAGATATLSRVVPKSFIDAVKVFSTKTFTAIFGTFTKITKGIFSPIFKKFSVILKPLSAFTGIFTRFLGDFTKIIPSIITNIKESQGIFGTFFRIGRVFGKFLAWPLTVVIGLYNMITEAKAGFEREGVLGAFKGALWGIYRTLIGDLLSLVWDAGKYVYDMVKPWVDGAVVKVVSLFNRFINSDFVMWFRNIVSTVTDTLDTTLSTFVRTLGEQLGFEFPEDFSIRNMITQFATKLKNWVAGLLSFSSGESSSSSSSSWWNPMSYFGTGDVTEQYESGGRGVGTISNTANDPGGKSYGKYQLSSSSMKSFLSSDAGSGFASEFAGLNPNSQAFANQYSDVVSRRGDEMGSAQRRYIMRTHFMPAIQYAKGRGFDVQDPGIREAIFSMSVQHSPSGWKKILNGVNPNQSPEQVIRGLYKARGSYVSSLSSLDPQLKSNILSRYGREVNDVVAVSRNAGSMSNPTMTDQSAAMREAQTVIRDIETSSSRPISMGGNSGGIVNAPTNIQNTNVIPAPISPRNTDSTFTRSTQLQYVAS